MRQSATGPTHRHGLVGAPRRTAFTGHSFLIQAGSAALRMPRTGPGRSLGPPRPEAGRRANRRAGTPNNSPSDRSRAPAPARRWRLDLVGDRDPGDATASELPPAPVKALDVLAKQRRGRRGRLDRRVHLGVGEAERTCTSRRATGRTRQTGQVRHGGRAGSGVVSNGHDLSLLRGGLVPCARHSPGRTDRRSPVPTRRYWIYIPVPSYTDCPVHRGAAQRS